MSIGVFEERLAHPTSTSKVPDEPAPISEEQEVKLQHVISHFADPSYRLKDENGSIVKSSDGDALTDAEQMFLSREGCLRFLVAVKDDVSSAITRLEKCLLWRRSMDIDDVQGFADKVEAEFVRTGGQIVFGYSAQAQPVIVMVPSRRNTEPTEVGLHHLFFLLERAIDLMPPGVSKVTFLIDFSSKRKYSTPVGLAKQWVDVLQNHYVERLGVGMIVNIPWIINMFLQAVYVFMDPVTKAKILLNPPEKKAAEVIPADQLQKPYGGHVELEWTEAIHHQYWPALLKTCKDRRSRNLQNWNQMGGGVGKSELEWKRMTHAQLAGTDGTAA